MRHLNCPLMSQQTRVRANRNGRHHRSWLSILKMAHLEFKLQSNQRRSNSNTFGCASPETVMTFIKSSSSCCRINRSFCHETHIIFIGLDSIRGFANSEKGRNGCDGKSNWNLINFSASVCICVCGCVCVSVHVCENLCMCVCECNFLHKSSILYRKTMPTNKAHESSAHLPPGRAQ